MLRVGLTGGIASGKSHVAARLERAGLRTLDLDRVGHDVIAPTGPAYAEVVDAFGKSVLAPDGSIDRKALAAIVFSDPAARNRLNVIVHPRIRVEEARLVSALDEEPEAVLVVEAALLVETGQHLRFDRLVATHCGPREQLRRLEERGLDVGAASARLRAQMASDDKRRFAHFVVDTSGSVAETDDQTDRIASALVALAKPAPAVHLVPERAAALAFGGPLSGPAGLTSVGLIEEMADGLDLERLSRRMAPSVARAWYAPLADAEVGPEALAGAVALYGILKRGNDPDYTAAVAYSVARLTHVSAPALARAVLFALAAHENAIGCAEPTAELGRRLAERWTGYAPDLETCRAAAEQAAKLVAAAPETSPQAEATLARLSRRRPV